MDEKVKILFAKSKAFKQFANFLTENGYTYKVVGSMEAEKDVDRSSFGDNLLAGALSFVMYPADVEIYKDGKVVAFVKQAFRAGYDYKKGKDEGTMSYYQYKEMQEEAAKSRQSIEQTKLELEYVYFYEEEYTSDTYGLEHYKNEYYQYFKYARGKAKRLYQQGYALTFNAAKTLLKELEAGEQYYKYKKFLVTQ
jgi:hypothetical protein